MVFRAFSALLTVLGSSWGDPVTPDTLASASEKSGASSTFEVLNVGILGAANIAPPACTNPLKYLGSYGKAYAVAARSRPKAEAFAKRHSIPVVHDSYDALLDDLNVHVVFNPLPNGLHHKWTIAALRKGKHVLCEKPLTSNEAQAIEIKQVLDEINSKRATPLVCAEAFHWKCHPAALHLKKMLRGEVPGWNLGTIKKVKTTMHLPSFFGHDDIRYNFDLAGGAIMDLTYVFSTTRFVVEHGTKMTPEQAKNAKYVVESATPVLFSKDPRIDEQMHATVRHVGSDILMEVDAKFRAGYFYMKFEIEITGEDGTLVFNGFAGPSIYHYFEIKRNDGTSEIKKVYDAALNGQMPTYWHQMKAFLGVIRGEVTDYHAVGLTTLDDSIVNMRLIDDVYRKAHMPLRP